MSGHRKPLLRRLVKAVFGRPYKALMPRLSGPPLSLSNLSHQQAVWDDYAKGWSASKVPMDDDTVGPRERQIYLTHLGDEWGRKQDVIRIVEEYILPYVTRESAVAEIGCGGGRVAAQVAGSVKSIECFDISVEMLKRARAALASFDNVRFHRLSAPRLDREFEGKLDFIYSFDVLVHLDLSTIWAYFREIFRCLRPTGRAFLHTTNLAAPAGWENFSSQDGSRPIDHYFICPEIIDILAGHSNFRIVKRSQPDPGNVYLSRDYLFVLEKPAESAAGGSKGARE